ncbi:hypothetical protein ACJBWN_12225 [Streptococcus suis]
MDEQEKKFLCKLNVMLLDIEHAYEAEKENLKRCELSKGYL